MSEGKLKGGVLLDQQLADYKLRSLTARLCDALFKATPGAPGLPNWDSLDDTFASVAPEASADVRARAKALANDAQIDNALFAAKSLDTGDAGITILTGVRSALSLFLGDKGPGAGADDQQKADAALKALGLAYILTQLIPREPAQRVHLLESTDSGLELLLYYVTLEVAVPSPEDVQAANGTFIKDLVAEQSRRVAGKLLGVIGRKGVQDAQETLDAMIDLLDRKALERAPQAGQLAASLQGVLPAVVRGKGPALQDAVAAGADALPAWRYLTARFAAESRVMLAVWEDDPAAEPRPIPASEKPAAPPPPPPSLPANLAGAATAAHGHPESQHHEVAAEPENPFAAPAEPENPFAAPNAPANPFAEPTPEPEPAPALPTEALPAEHRLNGVYLRSMPWGEMWLVFTREGIFSNFPPANANPDWMAHSDAGHQVGTYRREEEELTIRWPSGKSTTSQIVRDTYSLQIDGEQATRCDFNLAGRVLNGSWRSRDGETQWTFHRNGKFEGPDGPGRYQLTTGGIQLERPGQTPHHPTLYTTLQPDPERPDCLWIGGLPFDRT
ncbi:MAG: hypothetical protein GWP91_06675 [Rhodobacterales bacterium]|nr:hypothetical protein [Rhodobacterales bacterium]